MKSFRVAGHSMPHEGQALDERGSVRRDYHRDGKTRCECGEWSPALPSNGARKRWHRDHKNQIFVDLVLAPERDAT
jgi:hypothetical protein